VQHIIHLNFLSAAATDCQTVLICITETCSLQFYCQLLSVSEFSDISLLSSHYTGNFLALLCDQWWSTKKVKSWSSCQTLWEPGDWNSLEMYYVYQEKSQ